MILCDVNVLVYAVNSLAPQHSRYKKWVDDLVRSREAFGLSELVLSAWVRIVTNPRIVPTPVSPQEAIEIADDIRSRPNCVLISPGPRHWQIFSNLCIRANARGNLVPDAYLAALAIESGSEWITTDRDYARFPGLRWRHPFDT
jgi:toxin-antitoxin system PIN domain toxin